MTDIITGKVEKDSLAVLLDNTQVYGVAVNDTTPDSDATTIIIDTTDAVMNADTSDDTSNADTVSGTTVTLDDKDDSPYTLVSPVKDADASSRKKAIKINGNALNNSIVGGAKNDTLWGDAGNDTLDGGAGNDSINAGNAGNDLLIGGDGNDYLWGYSGNNTLYGDKGNDILDGGRGNDYLDGGEGNDELYGDNGADVFVLSEGKDTVTDFSASDGDKVLIGDNDTPSVTYKYGNWLVQAGKKSLMLEENGDEYYDDHITITFVNGTGSTTRTYYEDGYVAEGKSVTLQSDYQYTEFTEGKYSTIDASAVKKGMYIIGVSNSENSIVGTAKNDTIEGGDVGDSLFGGAGNDSINGYYGDDTIDGGEGNDTLTGGYGADVFVLSAGKDTVADYSASQGDKILVDGTPSVTFTKNGVVVQVDKKNSLTLWSDGSVNSQTIIFTDGTNDTTNTYYDGYSVVDDSVSLSATYSQKTFSNDDGYSTIDASAVKGAVSIDGGYDARAIIGGAKNDTLVSYNASLTGGKGSDVFIFSGGNDTITDYETSDKISLGSADVSDVAVGDDNVVLTFEGGSSLTIIEGEEKKITLLEGKKSTACYFDINAIFDSSWKSVTLTAACEDFDASYGYSNLVTIDASGTSNATITGNSKANCFYGGMEGNVYVWTGGNDTLTNFTADDTLSINGEVSDATVTKGNSVLNVGKNKLTFDNADKVTFTDDGGTKIFSAGIFTDADETSATLPASFSQQNMKTPFTLDYATIDASNVKKALNLSLGDGNDSIHGGKKGDSIHGGDGNDTLTGGAGNDSLWGDNGADKFIYSKGDGKDVIFGFDDADMLEIIGLGDNVMGTLNKAGTELAIKVGKTAVAVLKDFTASTFNINGETYQLSGKALVKA